MDFTLISLRTLPGVGDLDSFYEKYFNFKSVSRMSNSSLRSWVKARLLHGFTVVIKYNLDES